MKKLKSPIIYQTDYDLKTASQLDERIKQYYSDSPEKSTLLIEYPTVYVINDSSSTNTKSSKFTVYVGETNDIQRRTLQHLDSDPKDREDFFGLKKSKNATMYVIGQEHFNKSMTLDIENRLMQYLSSVPAVKKINNRRHNEQNKYYDSKEFEPLFKKIWKKLGRYNSRLFPAQELLESSALFKASPFNKLTSEQLAAKQHIIEKINEALYMQKDKQFENGKLIFVEGEAGAGKTVLMSNIFYDLVHEDQLTYQENKNVTTKKVEAVNRLSVAMIVNQDEQLTVYKNIATKLFDKNELVQVVKPVKFIKGITPKEKVDIAIIDEAHLLLTQNNQSYANDKDHPKVKVGKNMLKDILKRAKVVMAVFDPNQILTTSAVWEDNDFEKMEDYAGKDNVIHLHNQMRIDASANTIKWIQNLVDNGKIGKIPKDNKYQIKIFKDPAKMQKAIEEKNKNQDQGISRMVATFDWNYSGGDTEPPVTQKYWKVQEGNWSMPWNREIKKRDKYESKHRKNRTVKYSEQSWAEKDYTINEIGSTYTVQGFDLNYVGVELGPSVKYRNGKIFHDPSASANEHAIQKRNSTKSYAEKLLKNEFNVLMTRGVHGLYIHAIDPELQKALEEAAQ